MAGERIATLTIGDKKSEEEKRMEESREKSS